jgi:plasmid maintenance system antidote protein VapI
MPKQLKNFQALTDVLREEILENELSYKRLEKETGVIRQSLMAFARGEQSLRLDKADKLAEFFGIEIIRGKAK